jgi:hypothetical protein
MSSGANEPTAKLILGAGAVLAAPLFAGATLAGAVGSAAPAAVTPAGGRALTPSIVQRQATAGAAAVLTVANTTEHTMRVTLRSRPWRQAADGTVSPDPHRTLAPLVRMSPTAFTMAPHSRRTIRLTLRRHPPGGSLYGALDLTGIPLDARLPNGIVPRFRLIGSLRLDPASIRRRVQPGALDATGRRGRHAIAMPLRNLGNSIEPIAGRRVPSQRTARRARDPKGCGANALGGVTRRSAVDALVTHPPLMWESQPIGRPGGTR